MGYSPPNPISKVPDDRNVPNDRATLSLDSALGDGVFRDNDTFLRQFIQVLHPATDLKGVVQRGVEAIAQSLPLEQVQVLHYMPSSRTWTLMAALEPDARPDIPASHLFSNLEKSLQALLATGSTTLANLDRGSQPWPMQWTPGGLLVGLPNQPAAQPVNPWWGALHLCFRPGHVCSWSLLRDLALHLAIAIQEAETCRQLHRRIAELERQVQARTAQLELAADFEATLKRITDKVRDSLDEHQILQIAVQELTIALGAQGCNAALYNLEQGISTIRYEHTTTGVSFEGHVADMGAFPEIYSQLLDGIGFQFCSIFPNPLRGHVTMFACPIQDDMGVLGDLWLITQHYSSFRAQDLRLVALVANQCAIALRQSRLFQATQAQVCQLERLNRLKDDFLSTISHELRTPMASIKMATHLLELGLNRLGCLDETSPIWQYFNILKTQCQRETDLINDLLDLSQLDGDPGNLHVHALNLNLWLPQIVEPFAQQARTRGQAFELLLAAELPFLNTDGRLLERILAELLTNAGKYTPADGAIALRVYPLLSAEGHPLDVHIRICNQGVEIPLEEIPHIFDKFYRLPSADPWQHSGTGLGLALAQKLAGRLGGSLQAESQAQQTCFTLCLPVG